MRGLRQLGAQREEERRTVEWIGRRIFCVSAHKVGKPGGIGGVVAARGILHFQHFDEQLRFAAPVGEDIAVELGVRAC